MSTITFALQNWWLTFLYNRALHRIVHTHCGGCGEKLAAIDDEFCQSCLAW